LGSPRKVSDYLDLGKVYREVYRERGLGKGSGKSPGGIRKWACYQNNSTTTHSRGQPTCTMIVWHFDLDKFESDICSQYLQVRKEALYYIPIHTSQLCDSKLQLKKPVQLINLYTRSLSPEITRSNNLRYDTPN
jgi:hypothetical protein